MLHSRDKTDANPKTKLQTKPTQLGPTHKARVTTESSFACRMSLSRCVHNQFHKHSQLLQGFPLLCYNAAL